MREVIHPFSVETDWLEEMARGLGGGVVFGNRFVIPEEVYTGVHYILTVSSEITAMLADVTYHQDVLFKLRNKKDDFVGIYYNLTEGESAHIIDDAERPMGRWQFNLAVVDSSLELDYLVKEGTKTYNLCLFIKKKLLKAYLASTSTFATILDQAFDASQNTIVRYDRMSNAAWHLLNELRKKKADDRTFDLFLGATVYLLLGNYLDQLIKQDILIEKVDSADLRSIIACQSLLIDRVEDAFPGIQTLAQEANMSETKFKRLYLKITGMSASSFFMDNKIGRAKDLLDSRQYTIAEVAHRLHFSGPSHLTSLFKNRFGILPKEYSSLL